MRRRGWSYDREYLRLLEEEKKNYTPSQKKVLRGAGLLQSGIRTGYNTRPGWAIDQS
jgi:hypothetical protein